MLQATISYEQALGAFLFEKVWGLGSWDRRWKARVPLSLLLAFVRVQL